ncbi:hypothetical protein QF023_002593 [Chryseobacterium sp. SLBN-27]|uniref:hypothetical protein n=1 Tax=Chryseobacterium sp. SLBN-27 TaxID=3042287 RepID=UPI002857FA21|nr:hypothetical protein [Chryseobacterium sp. SLBN-27]MDR6159077.1 hypothetical protein [Chryseobacterium sp. SLBN-27]
MKKSLKFSIFLALAVAFSSCKQDDVYYEGDPYLFFNKGESGDAYVEQGSTYNDVTVDYGAMRGVDGNNEVSLVVDTQNSTAQEGVQFQLLNNGKSQIGNGANSSKFTIRILESGNTAVAKHAVFKLKSTSIGNAQYNQSYTLNMSLKCPVSNFVGNFVNNEAWWYDPGYQFEIVQSTTANQLLVKDFWDSGRDLVLNYNPDTFVVTVPEQYTGQNYTTAPYNSQIWAKASTDATQVSTFNTCTRKLTLYVNYYLNAYSGVGFGNQKEAFSGL